MRHIMIFVVCFLVGLGFTRFVVNAHGKEAPKVESKQDLPCANNTDIEKIMADKGYVLLMNMTRKEDNKEGIIESLWIGGDVAVITATVPKGESSCLIANMGNVIVNPNAIESIWEAYKKQNKQKDI